MDSCSNCEEYQLLLEIRTKIFTEIQAIQLYPSTTDAILSSSMASPQTQIITKISHPSNNLHIDVKPLRMNT